MNEFIHFVDSLRIDSQLKADLTDPSTLRGHALYINLVNYLLPLYPKIDQDKAQKLALSGYLYFRFLLLFDNYIDNQATHPNEKETEKGASLHKVVVAFEFYEESIKGLSQLFPGTSKFWKDFSKVKGEYYQTVLMEKEISKTNPPITEDTFLNIAAGKSAICNAMVYALVNLSGTNDYTAMLLECLKHIHIGLQYQDDIEDFRKDTDQNQWTYARYLVQQYLTANGLIVSDPHQLHKYLYLSRVAGTLMPKAVYHLDKSIEIARSMQLSELTVALEKRKLIFNSYSDEIELLISKAEMKKQKENLFRKSQTVPDAVEAGTSYLLRNMNGDHTWGDFLTSAGFGNSWITAYVGMLMSEMNLNSDILSPVLSKMLRSGNMNAYNDAMIIDGDSTTFMIGFAKKAGSRISQEQISDWLSFMNPDGGFVTYRVSDAAALVSKLKLEDVGIQGWTAGKLCVTSAAAYVMSFCEELDREYRKCCQHLINNISSQGCWNSYWWTSPVYATSFSVMALSGKQEFRHYAASGAQWLVMHQHTEGYWPNEFLNYYEPSPLYTAMALKALLLFEPVRYQENIFRAVAWILKNQTADGSWHSSRALRIPATNVEDPAMVKKWRLSSFGVNCLVDDHNRIFTTATVVNAMFLYDEMSGVYSDSAVRHIVET